MNNIISDYSNNNPAKFWRTYNYNLDTSAGIAKLVARNKFAWPGGYELFAITDDGAALCFNCCRTEFWLIAHSDIRDGWHVRAHDSTATCEDLLFCDHCNKIIYDIEQE